MGTDTVTNGSDDANIVGSLRYEISHAQAGDVINFDPGVTQVALASTLTITQNVTIEGGSGVTVAGGGSSGGFSDFTIAKGVQASFDNLTISGGAFVGQDQTHAAASPTPGGSGGGAVTDYGTLTLSHTTISSNSGIGGHGSNADAPNFYKGGGAGGSAAGGIYVAADGELDLVGRTNAFASNTATGGDGGRGGYSTYSYGGNGGAGAHATTRYARGPSNNRRGGHGMRGGRSPLARGPSGAGAGGRAGMNGGDGRLYRVDSYYAPYTGIGTGGGGGGGNAFSDFGGKGAVRHVAATRSASAAVRSAAATCFTTGTLIRTRRGNVAVEALRVGDLAMTASGRERPIGWIGRRDIDGASQPVSYELWPVRISVGAFGRNVPERELRLSPGHPVLVGADADNEGGYLVPVMCLINGTTIERVEVETITYWHVELDTHDILLAEGLPAESYIDLGSRPWFAGADGPLYDPDLALPGQTERCRPVAIDGPVVEAERRRLDMIFAMQLAGACAWPDETHDIVLR